MSPGAVAVAVAVAASEVELRPLTLSIMLGPSLKRSREEDFEDELFAHDPKVRPDLTWNITRCNSCAAANLSHWTLLTLTYSSP
jgi:hypothetical protein